MKTKNGFTLIELVVVIVILGIMAAVALPRFVDLGPQARDAAAKGVAAAIAGGTATNYAARKAGAAGTTAVSAADQCVAAGLPALQALVTGVTLTSAAPANTNEFRITGGPANCSLPANDGAALTSCSVTAFGSGATAQTVTLICAQ